MQAQPVTQARARMLGDQAVRVGLGECLDLCVCVNERGNDIAECEIEGDKMVDKSEEVIRDNLIRRVIPSISSTVFYHQSHLPCYTLSLTLCHIITSVSHSALSSAPALQSLFCWIFKH